MSNLDIIFRTYFVPMILMSSTPIMVYWLAFININKENTIDGDLFGIKTAIDNWIENFFGSNKSIEIISYFGVFQLIIMSLFKGGGKYYGPITINGNIPVYKDNGLICYIVSLFTFIVSSFCFNLFSPTIIYNNFSDILASLNVLSVGFCTFLYLKGRFFPSNNDSGTSGNLIFDFYWGTELHPNILGINVKQFTNCRIGMMSWALIIISFSFKQHELYGISDSMIVSVILQLIYISKFFMWECGYFNSIDIMYDRAGYYICWGCLVWVPGFYTLTTLYLVHNPINLGYYYSLMLLITGTSFIMMNYFADLQRQLVRKTNGKCLVFGKQPLLIEAEYTTEKGDIHKSLLLYSGFWGLSRHFHYIPELIGSLCWALPSLYNSPVPYLYVIYLTILLVDRADRDDIKCQKKYGKYWTEYRKQVPYKIIPYIY